VDEKMSIEEIINNIVQDYGTIKKFFLKRKLKKPKIKKYLNDIFNNTEINQETKNTITEYIMNSEKPEKVIKYYSSEDFIKILTNTNTSQETKDKLIFVIRYTKAKDRKKLIKNYNSENFTKILTNKEISQNTKDFIIEIIHNAKKEDRQKIIENYTKIITNKDINKATKEKIIYNIYFTYSDAEERKKLIENYSSENFTKILTNKKISQNTKDHITDSIKETKAEDRENLINNYSSDKCTKILINIQISTYKEFNIIEIIKETKAEDRQEVIEDYSKIITNEDISSETKKFITDNMERVRAKDRPNLITNYASDSFIKIITNKKISQYTKNKITYHIKQTKQEERPKLIAGYLEITNDPSINQEKNKNIIYKLYCQLNETAIQTIQTKQLKDLVYIIKKITDVSLPKDNLTPEQKEKEAIKHTAQLLNYPAKGQEFNQEYISKIINEAQNYKIPLLDDQNISDTDLMQEGWMKK